MKRIISIVLCFMLVFTLCPSVFAAGENVCEIGERKFATLDDALNVVGDGETIRLLEHIDYSGGIAIVDKSIIFNLNGFNLNVLNATGGETIEENSGLYVEGNSTVSLEGEGEFNVTGTWYGVFAECNEGESAEVTVTNATGIGRDGVAAQSSKVTVKGDATSRGSTYSGVWASYENAEVIVEGDVYANGEMSMGVNTDTLASVTVKGSVIVDGDNSIGIKASDDGDVTVEGNVTVSGIDCIGVSFLSVADQPSIVTIKGVIEAEKYILFEAEDESKWEYSLRDGDFDEETADYIYYTKDNVSFVYVSMFAGGSGTVEDPYLIAHATQLYNIKYYHLFDKHYKQIADIDLDGYFSLGEGWDPIGLGESPFLGVYEGDGHTISNLFINRPYQGDIGLFGCVGEGSEILNVGLINADVTGRHEVGGLAAINGGLITNSYVIGEVSGTTYAGGLIGYNMGSVTDSYFDGTVSHVKGYEADGVEYAGGLVGDNFQEGSITGCYAKATVESEGPLIGGLAGGNLGSITDSHAISNVTGFSCVGGLTGDNRGIINNSYADGNVTAVSYAGGLVGQHESPHPITNSYFTGTVTAPGGVTGGLVGYSLGSISNCHAGATVTSTEGYVGGLAGRSIGLITGSWSAGAVTGGSHVGGLVGATFINAGSGGISEISASYSACAVTGKSYIGGLVGSNETPISESYAKGNVTKADEVDFTYTHFGGLVGKNTGPVGDSYAWGNVSGHQYVGGLIGYNEADVTNCYEIGAVSGNSNTGGLIGVNSSGANIVGSFWNNNTSGQESSDGGISAGSVAMKQQATYDSNVEADWDFDTIWGIDTDENDGYPFLIWQVGAEFAGGSGTPEDPYLIATADQLYNVRNHLDKHFGQIADLDLSGYRSGSGWAPIGTSTNTFTGTFDGNGHTIKGLYIAQVGASNNYIPAGLFGYTEAEAEICNLALKSVDVIGCYYVGSLVGNNSGDISNVSVSGSVTGEWDTGGLVGRNNGSLIGSCFMGDVTGTKKIEYGDWTGGLVGYNRGAITNCWADATVVSEGDSVGGLVGESLTEGIITGSCSAGTVTANDYTGGLTGSNSGEITACYSLCTVNGGLDVGGLVGGNSGPITDSFAAGAVAGTNRIGGLVGSSMDATVTGCYWDKETSLLNTSAGGTGKTTAEMKQLATFENWDFVAIWDINASFNDGYPFLRWQNTEAVTVPAAPQTFIATPGDGQVALSWTAPASDGGSAVTKYQVSKDNGVNWTDAGLNTTHTFTGLINGTEYTFKVRAVNSAGNGAEVSVSATPTDPVSATHTVNFYSNGSLYASKTVTSDSALGANWPDNPTKSGYSFGGWFSGQNGAGTLYTSSTTITADVDLYAKWTYKGGGGGGSSTPTTPTAPAYKADVKAENGTETTLPVTVDKDAEIASIGTDSQSFTEGGTIITIPSIPNVDTYSVGIPVPDLSTTDVQGTLNLNTNAGNITVPSNMLTGITDADGDKAQITIGQGDKSSLPEDVQDAVGDRPLVQLTLSIDGRQTNWNNPNAPVTVSMLYTPTAEELVNPESIVIWYIDGNGNTIVVPNGRYDVESGTVIFTTTHFSYFAVGYNKVSFTDVAENAWYNNAVSFIAARGITSGTGNGRFSPELNLTRGQFITLLLKAYRIAADENPINNFADAGNTWYTGYLAAARRLGISAGVGNNMFAPDKEITRQEMVTLLYNALKVIGQLPKGVSGKKLADFTDTGSIAPWAKEAMAYLVETGNISGSGGKLEPTGGTTRAQMAQVLYNLIGR